MIYCKLVRSWLTNSKVHFFTCPIENGRRRWRCSPGAIERSAGRAPDGELLRMKNSTLVGPGCMCWLNVSAQCWQKMLVFIPYSYLVGGRVLHSLRAMDAALESVPKIDRCLTLSPQPFLNRDLYTCYGKTLWKNWRSYSMKLDSAARKERKRLAEYTSFTQGRI